MSILEHRSLRKDLNADLMLRGGTSSTRGRPVRILIKLLLLYLVILVIQLVSVVSVNFFAPYVYGGGYGRILAQNDYAEYDHSYNEVLIIGDSLAQVSYMPSELSAETYNYGIGNETPVDGYYRLRVYLNNHPKPKYIFCSYNPTEFSALGSIWSTPILLHVMPLGMAREILEEAKNYQDNSGLLCENPMVQLFLYYYGLHPNVVSHVFSGLARSIFIESCYISYQENYNWVVEHHGQWKHRKTGGSGDDINMAVTSDVTMTFTVTDMADAYMKKIAALCDDMSIQLIIETIPFNESTYLSVSSSYIDSYREYWKQFQQTYPNTIVNGEITSYENRFFGDCYHFNSEGTDRYSQYIREKYAYIFEETNI